MYLKPNPDRNILLRDPRSGIALPAHGGNVPNSSFWIRRKLDGDAVPTTLEAIEKGLGAKAAGAKPSKTKKTKARKTITELSSEAIAADTTDTTEKED